MQVRGCALHCCHAAGNTLSRPALPSYPGCSVIVLYCFLPYGRVDPALKLTGVPTLFAWGASGPARRLGPELEACGSPQEVEQLLEKTRFMSG